MEPIPSENLCEGRFMLIRSLLCASTSRMSLVALLWPSSAEQYLSDHPVLQASSRVLTAGLIPSPSKYASTNCSATQSLSTAPKSLNTNVLGCFLSPVGAVSSISKGVPLETAALGKSDLSLRSGDCIANSVSGESASRVLASWTRAVRARVKPSRR